LLVFPEFALGTTPIPYLDSGYAFNACLSIATTQGIMCLIANIEARITYLWSFSSIQTPSRTPGPPAMAIVIVFMGYRLMLSAAWLAHLH